MNEIDALMEEVIEDAKILELQERAESIGIEAGWLWLYENGFGHRVPEEVKEKIEDAKLKDAFKRKEA